MKLIQEVVLTNREQGQSETYEFEKRLEGRAHCKSTSDYLQQMTGLADISDADTGEGPKQ